MTKVGNIGGSSQNLHADQWIYVFMAGLFVLTAIFSFYPTSTGLIAAVAAGERPPPPFILHVHAAAMASWLILLLAQTLLMASRRRLLHQRLGLASFLLAPVMLVAMIGVQAWPAGLAATLPPEVLSQIKQTFSNRLLINAGAILFFPVFYLWAILTRGKDSETHKRMMILATLVLMSPAIGRLVSVSSLLPDFGLRGTDARHLYELLLLLPALIYDGIKRGALHRAYLIGLGLIIPYMIAAHFLWDSPWWREIALRLMGAE